MVCYYLPAFIKYIHNKKKLFWSWFWIWIWNQILSVKTHTKQKTHIWRINTFITFIHVSSLSFHDPCHTYITFSLKTEEKVQRLIYASHIVDATAQVHVFWHIMCIFHFIKEWKFIIYTCKKETNHLMQTHYYDTTIKMNYTTDWQNRFTELALATACCKWSLIHYIMLVQK